MATSPYFPQAFQKRRALVPANGWFEWRKTEADDKQPQQITHADGELLMFAGLLKPAGDGQATATIITQPSVTTLIHPRMPTVLAPGCWESWMDPELTNRERIRETARPLPSDALVAYLVSKRVNRPLNEGAALIEPEGDVGEDPAPLMPSDKPRGPE